MTPQERLAVIADLITPCPPPDIAAGHDLCPCGNGVWPYATTRAAWLARGHNPAGQIRAACAQAARAAAAASPSELEDPGQEEWQPWPQ